MEKKYNEIFYSALGGGRHNEWWCYSSTTNGTVYALRRFGAGRFQDGWWLGVYAPEALYRTNARYKGTQVPEQFFKGQKPLIEFWGDGGQTSHRGFSSKGGYSPASENDYHCSQIPAYDNVSKRESQGFDGSLLDDPDEFIRVVWNINPDDHPTEVWVSRIKEFIETENAKYAAASVAYMQKLEADRLETDRLRKLRLEEMEKIFSSVILPEGFSGKVTEQGFVLDSTGNSSDLYWAVNRANNFRYVLTTLEDVETVNRLAAELLPALLAQRAERKRQDEIYSAERAEQERRHAETVAAASKLNPADLRRRMAAKN